MNFSSKRTSIESLRAPSLRASSRRVALATLLSLLASNALADATSIEDLFSDLPYKGAVECSVLDPKPADEGGGYLNEKLAVFTEPHVATKLSESQPLKRTCAQGGGDCLCYVMFLSEAPGLDPKSSFIQVFDGEKAKKFWVNVPKDKLLPVTDLVVNQGALAFREPEPPIYVDQELKHKISSVQMKALTIIAEKQIRERFPNAIGKLTIVPPRGASKARAIVRSLKKDAQTETIVLSENMDFILTRNSGAREFPVMKKEGSRYLIVTESGKMPSIANYSHISIDRHAFWMEVDGAETRFTPVTKQAAVTESPLFGAIKYVIKERKLINGRLHARLEIAYQMDTLLLDPEGEAEERAQTFKLRDVWIPMTDDKGRLTFILEPIGGC